MATYIVIMRTRPIIGLRKLEQTTFMALHALTAACYRLWLKLTGLQLSPYHMRSKLKINENRRLMHIQ